MIIQYAPLPPKFQSTLPARGATSIIDGITGSIDISIHAPRTGSDLNADYQRARDEEFQSTLPARGATESARRNEDAGNISIHAPRTGSDERLRHHGNQGETISIHAPRTGSDQFRPGLLLAQKISIHAPRTGSDPLQQEKRWKRQYFNPRSPHGERHGIPQEVTLTSKIFQSTLPARGATLQADSSLPTWQYFNPRSPHGERPTIELCALCTLNFNPRSPHGERHPN